MEDASVVALIWSDEMSVEARLDLLAAAARDIAALIAAAQVLQQS